MLVKREPLPETTEAGIFILGREYPTIGVVQAIGNGARNPSTLQRQAITDVAVGDYVWYERKSLDTREINPGTFILDYDLCNAAARRGVDGKFHLWPLKGKVLVKRESL